jgi:hypothetical protein
VPFTRFHVFPQRLSESFFHDIAKPSGKNLAPRKAKIFKFFSPAPLHLSEKLLGKAFN